MVPLWVARHGSNGLEREAVGSCVGEFAEREPRMDPKHNPNDELLDASSDVTGTIELATEGALALNVAADPSAPVTREQRRSRRKRAIRARTISVKRMTKRELELGRLLYPDTEEFAKPVAREDCQGGARPCPFVSCKHHLYLDVSARTGAIKLNFPDLEVWEMTETCALDVADRGGTTLEEVGAIMNLTRERIRQVEVKGLAKLAALRDMSTLRDYVDEGPTGKRRLPVLVEVDDDEEDEAPAEAAEASAEVSVEAPAEAEGEAW
jgi:Sigma-70, region 4